MNIRKRIRRFSLVALIIMLTIVFAVAIAACNGNKDAHGTYYLSLQSNDWKTYDSEKDIPEKYLFTQSNGEDGIYNLSIALEENEQFTINTLGSSAKIGYEALFSAENILMEGENGSLKVFAKATFDLRYDANNHNLTYTYTAEIVSVSITAPTNELYVGDSYTFTGTVLYSDKTVKSDVSWSSSDPNVATITNEGVVTAIAVGTTTIKAVAGNSSDEIEITVQPNLVPVESVELDHDELKLELNEEAKLTPTVLPENATNKAVLFTSNDESIASVTEDGVVKAVGYGVTTITVTTANGGKATDCEVTVIRHVEAIRLDTEEITVVAQGLPKTIAVSFAPSDSTNMDLTVSIVSGNDSVSVSSVENQISVQGLSEGKAEICVTSTDNPEAVAYFNVTVLAEKSVLPSLPNFIRLKIDEEQVLTPTIENAEIRSVSWSITDTDVARITQQTSGSTSVTVAGVAFGTTTIRATVYDMNQKVYSISSEIQVTDDYFFIYGYGFGEYDWDYEHYVSDKNAAERAGILFEEEQNGIYTLTRYLTPQNGFQIIFPTVGSYLDEATRQWNRNIPSDSVPASEYYDASRSDSQYVSNSSSYFRVNTAGTYRITLDLTGTVPKVYIENISVDLASIGLALQNDNMILRSGESAIINFTLAPEAAIVDEKDLIVELKSTFANYSDYVTFEVNFAARTITVTVAADPEEEIHLNVICSVGEVSSDLELVILPANGKVTPVTEIAFEQEHYYFNVNNGEGNWTTIVKAAVNPDATIQQVRYACTSSIPGFSSNYFVAVDPDLGAVTGLRLGTFEIKATAVGNEDYTATCYVTFYSDVLYLTGEFNEMNSYEALDQSQTTTEGTKFEKYTFTMDSKTHFTLEVYLEKVKNYNGDLGREEYGFQIAHLGMNDNWTSLIYGCADREHSYGYSDHFGSSGGAKSSWKTLVAGTYILEVDLSGTSPVAFFNLEETMLQDISLHSEKQSARKGETVEVQVLPYPSFTAWSSAVEWSARGNENEYISYKYDEATKTLSVTVINSEHADDDKTVTLTCTIGELSAEVTLTIVAEHHFVKRWDDVNHWLSCIDKGCDYTEGETAHIIATTMTVTDPEGHYFACEECGYKSELVSHTVSLQNDSFSFTEDQKCTCGFTFYTMEGTTLTGYFANAPYVKIPDSVTAIGNNVFAGHSEILILTLPNQLQSIGTEAFKDCSALLTVMIPRTVTKIGESAFSGVSASVMWEKNATIEEINGFQGYLGASFTFPGSAKYIYNYGFSGSHLTSIVIPDGVRLYNGVFKDCKFLEWAIIGKTSNGGIQGYTFQNCVNLKKVFTTYDTSFHEGLVSINAFAGCTKFEALFFPFDYTFVNDAKTRNTIVTLGNEALIGHCYAYAAEPPQDDSWLLGDDGKEAPAAKYFAGTWHYIDGEERSFDNVAIWDTAKTVSTQTTLFYIEKRKEMFD